MSDSTTTDEKRNGETIADEQVQHHLEELAKLRLQDDGYDLEQAGEWDPMDGYGYKVDSLEFGGGFGHAEVPGGRIRVDREHGTPGIASVTYGVRDAPRVSLELAVGDKHELDALYELTAGEARRLAVLLASAAEEVERRPVAPDEPTIAAKDTGDGEVQS